MTPQTSTPSGREAHRYKTPKGFRNLRVLVPESLHWRLRRLATESQMNFQQFIVAWLSEAFPLNPPPSPPAPPEAPGSPPGKPRWPGPPDRPGGPP